MTNHPRYRYEVRDASGAALSRHRSRLAALDALATLRARAAREGTATDAAIWDVQAGAPMLSIPAHGEESPDLLVRLSPAQKAALRRLAAEIGSPSMGGLVQQITDGALTVSRPERAAP